MNVTDYIYSGIVPEFKFKVHVFHFGFWDTRCFYFPAFGREICYFLLRCIHMAVVFTNYFAEYGSTQIKSGAHKI